MNGSIPAQLAAGLRLLVLASAVAACGGETEPPPPIVVQSLEPSSATAGSGALTVAAIGSGFATGAVLRWNGADRPTRFVSAARVEGTIAAGDLASGAEAAVTVRSPDGSSASGAVTFTVRNPLPVADSLQPASWPVGVGGLEVVVRGHGFVPTSVVRFNGADRLTIAGDSTSLRAVLTVADVAAAGAFDVTVVNPAPGGGTSVARTLTLLNPVPIPVGLAPATAAAGGASFALTVTGGNFAQGAVVTWNGSDRPTTVVGATTLTATIGAADVAAAGLAEVRVRNPGPGGGTSAPLLLAVGAPVRADSTIPVATVTLETTFLVSDAGAGIVYAAAPDAIVAFTGATGAVAFAIPVSGTPRHLALSDDGAYLYAAFDEAPVVRRIKVSSRAQDLSFDLATGTPLLVANDLVVVPGSPHAVVVARNDPHTSPGARGVAVYDDGVQRGAIALASPIGGELASDQLAATDNPAVVYGLDAATTEHAVRRYTVSLTGGVTAGERRLGLFNAFWDGEISFGFGRLFGTGGSVVLAEPGTREGALATSGWVCADSPAGRVYVLGPAGGITAYNPVTRAAIGSVATGSGVNHLVRWGADGFAYRTNTTVVFVRTTLVR
jgi:hypothetical protein